MSQQLTPSEFLDRAILLLAARHGADPELADDIDQEKRWFEVSRDMQALAKSPSCRSGDNRIVSTQVDDAEAFSPQACVNRAQFAMYRLEREAQQQKPKKVSSVAIRTADALAQQYVDPRDPKPSGFNITKHSIADAVNQIMEDCRRRIMNSDTANSLLSLANGNGAGSSDDDDDDDNGKAPLEIYKPPQHIANSSFLTMSEEETRKAMERGQAEEELINRVHKLQMEHFSKYKRWINLGTGESEKLSDMSTATKAALLGLSEEDYNTQQQQQANRSQQLPKIGKMSADDVAELLGKLNLGEHVGRFRRTNGSLLSTMTKEDIRLRFDNDNEATDILWNHLETKMVRDVVVVPRNNNTTVDENRPRLSAGAGGRYGSSSNNNNNKESSQMRAIYEAISRPSEDLAISQAELDEFEARNNNDNGDDGSVESLKDQLRQGNFHALKRTLDILEGAGGVSSSASNGTGSGGRPLRPSQEYKVQEALQAKKKRLQNHHQQDEDEDDQDDTLNDLTNSYMTRLNTNPSASSKSEQQQQQQTASRQQQSNNYGRGGGTVVGGGRGGGRGGGSASTTSVNQVAPTSTSSGGSSSTRTGRWAIVEYDEDEDNVE